MRVKMVCERLGLKIYGIWNEQKKDFLRDQWGFIISSPIRKYMKDCKKKIENKKAKEV